MPNRRDDREAETARESESRDLAAEVAAALAATPAAAGTTLLVAWSGGLDSTVLLHLLVRDDRVAAAVGRPRVIAAHLDHAMRPDSAAAAAAARAIAAAWGVEYRTHRLGTPPESEEEARTRRYAWLEEVAAEVGAEEIWTGHHADDQAETVLFRVLRGTGVAGLEGIPAERGRVRRPLLMLPRPVWRTDLRRFAVEHDLPVLPDPSNERPVATRNRLRNEALPLLADIVPGTADALLRLARNASRAAEEADALAAAVVRLSTGPGEPPSEARHEIPAALWRDADRPLRRALVRHLASRMGVSLSEASTLAALDLPPDAQSGRGVDLPGGLRFEREFDRWRLFARNGDHTPPGGRERIEIAAEAAAAEASGGHGPVGVWLGGRRRTVRWAVGAGSDVDGDPCSLALDLPASAFPLTLRAWRAGDRIARAFGTTPVAKVWSEARVPRRERASRWVLVDREGDVVAAEGLGEARFDPTIEGSAATPGTLHLRLDVEE